MGEEQEQEKSSKDSEFAVPPVAPFVHFLPRYILTTRRGAYLMSICLGFGDNLMIETFRIDTCCLFTNGFLLTERVWLISPF